MNRTAKGLLAGWFLAAVITIPVILAGILLFVETFLVSLPVGLLLFALVLGMAGVGTVPAAVIGIPAVLATAVLGARRLGRIDGERKRAELVRADTERHLRQILETSSDACVAIGADGLIVDWNRDAEALLGWPRETTVGRPLAETVIPEPERVEFLRGLQAAVTSGDDPVVGRALEISAIHRDGHQMPVEMTISPTPGGHMYQAFIRVTGHSRWAEEEAERTRTLLADLLNSAPDAVVIADERGQITLVNEQTERLFGYDRTEMVGAAVETLLPRRFRKRHSGHRTGYLDAPGTRPMGFGLELAGRRKDGTEFPVDISLSAITTDKGRLVTAFVRDITERKHTQDQLAAAHEKALEASRLKSEFVANMSHEIRTPLNGVMGMTGLLLDTNLSDEQREYAEAVRTSGDALMTVIEDILDFSKIEAGKLELMNETFSLRERMDDACAMLAPDADRKGLELVTWIDEGIPDAIWADGSRIRQVLVNLLSNAVKFTAEGEVLAKVTGGPDGTGRLALRFEVSDTGIGIDRAALSHIFESFSQADSSTTRGYGGTGLGLAISKRLVRLMDGDIGVNSEPGQGSTFWFTLAVGRARSGGLPDTAIDFGGVRTLVVDDNATSREILKRRFDAWGMDCEAVDGAVSAMAALRDAAKEKRPFRLAVIDSEMPGVDGVELAADIRADSLLDELDLLMMTSSGGRRGRVRQATVEAFIAKPVRESRLREEITRILSGLGPVPAEGAADGRAPAARSLSAKPVLVAEDNPVNQLVATRLLEKRGLRVDLATNGREAVTKHLEQGYEVIFMDCQMPELDGYQATAEIRRCEGEGHHTKIVAMTANTMKGDRERCLASGMDDYLGKPLDAMDLDQVLARAIPAHEGGDADLSAQPAPPEAEPLESPAVLDPASLDEICGRDANLREELVTMFIDQATAAVAQLGRQLDVTDLQAARRTAHSLKGSAAVLGAAGMAEIAGRLCAAAESGRADDAAVCKTELVAALALTADALTDTVRSVMH